MASPSGSRNLRAQINRRFSLKEAIELIQTKGSAADEGKEESDSDFQPEDGEVCTSDHAESDGGSNHEEQRGGERGDENYGYFYHVPETDFLGQGAEYLAFACIKY